MKKNMLVLYLGTLFLILLPSCNPAPPTLSPAEQDAILLFSEAKTDNLVAGLNAGDYAAFSRDFDQDMLTAIPQSEFAAFKLERETDLGLYISRQVNQVVIDGGFYAVIYDAVFEKDDSVTMRVVFRTAEPHEISGLWFRK